MGTIMDILGDGGALARSLPGYSKRAQQIELAEAVDDALFSEEHLVGEAPTGTGKSIAYLVPAIAHCVRHGKRAVVATANIALQEQLVKKDLPFLQSVLPWKFRYVLRKGKGNYLCESEHAQYLMRQVAQKDMFDGGRGRAHAYGEMARILDWAETTRTGDRSELPFIPSAANWRNVSVGQDDCKGKRCRWYLDCHAQRAAREALDAHIVVVNHHLLFANIKCGGAVLPPHEIVILDEAHEAPSIARDFLGFRMGEGTFKRLVSRLRRFEMPDLADEIAGRAQRFFADLGRFADSKEYGVRLKTERCVNNDKLRAALDRSIAALQSAKRRAVDEDHAATIEIEEERARNAMNILDQVMSLADKNLVIALVDDQDDKDRIWIEGKPLDVSGLLRATLFQDAESVVMVSATLAIDGGFEHFIDEIGVPEPEEIVVDSPFDPDNRIMVIPGGLPCPKDWREWQDAIKDVCADVIRAAGGRTLCLFTSHRVLKAVAEHLEAELADFRVLVQGQMPKTRMIDEFREDTRSVMLGTRGLWAGVDVQGESLSCVIIDKIPFASPGDPLQDAWQEKLGKKMFGRRMLPEAIIQWKQGVGRLIRSVDDRGVLVSLDRRMLDKGYGRKFIDALGEIEVSHAVEDVREFLGTAAEPEQPDDDPFGWDCGYGHGPAARFDDDIPF